MGCDIHFVVERKINDRWLGLFSTSPAPSGAIARRRNYAVFAMLAGVRDWSNRGPDPRGVPDDASELAKYHIESWGSNGHSHSWFSLRDFCDVYLKTVPEAFTSDYQRKEPWDVLFGGFALEVNGDDEAPEDIFRVVFWFDS